MLGCLLHRKPGVSEATSFFTVLTGSTMLGTTTDSVEAANAAYGNGELLEEDDPLYAGYQASSHQHALATYREMLGQEWVDEPLRELLETRVDELLER